MNDLFLDIPVMDFDKTSHYLQDGCKKYRFELDKKRCGIFQMVFQDVSNIEQLANYIETAEFRYGPIEAIIQTRLKMIVKIEGNTLICHSQTIIAARYILVAINEKVLRNATLSLANFVPKMYAYSDKGIFLSSDIMLNKIYDASKETIHMCTMQHHESYIARNLSHTERAKTMSNWKRSSNDFVLMDGPRRDREVWIGDLLPEMRTSWYAFGDKEVLKNSMLVFVDQQQVDGFIPASSVSFQDFKEYNCWFVIVLYEYVLLTGDLDFAKELRECYKSVLKNILKILDQNSLLNLGLMQTWAWTLARTGNITSSQCVLYHCLICASKLEQLFGYEDYAFQYNTIANQVKESINRMAWDTNMGAYKNIANANCNSYALDANALAVMFNVSNSDQARKTLDFLDKNLSTKFGTKNLYPEEIATKNNWCHNKHIWPFAVGFEVDARFSAGDYLGAVDLIKRCWGTMINQGSYTFWEFMDGSTGGFVTDIMQNIEVEGDFWNSYCHGWSAGVGYSIVSNVAGIKPLTTGFKKFEINLNVGGLEEIKAKVPTSFGDISMQKSGKRVKVNVPDGVSGVIKVGNYKKELMSGNYDIYVDF